MHEFCLRAPYYTINKFYYAKAKMMKTLMVFSKNAFENCKEQFISEIAKNFNDKAHAKVLIVEQT